MIFDKMSRIILVILFVMCLSCVVFFNLDIYFQLVFALLSGMIFLKDFNNSSAGHGRLTLIRLLERKWHFLASFTQWIFLLSLLVIPFIAIITLIYKVVIFVVIFVITAFVFYKFNNQPII